MALTRNKTFPKKNTLNTENYFFYERVIKNTFGFGDFTRQDRNVWLLSVVLEWVCLPTNIYYKRLSTADESTRVATTVVSAMVTISAVWAFQPSGNTSWASANGTSEATLL